MEMRKASYSIRKDKARLLVMKESAIIPMNAIKSCRLLRFLKWSIFHGTEQIELTP